MTSLGKEIQKTLTYLVTIHGRRSIVEPYGFLAVFPAANCTHAQSSPRKAKPLV